MENWTRKERGGIGASTRHADGTQACGHTDRTLYTRPRRSYAAQLLGPLPTLYILAASPLFARCALGASFPRPAHTSVYHIYCAIVHDWVARGGMKKRRSSTTSAHEECAHARAASIAAAARLCARAAPLHLSAARTPLVCVRVHVRATLYTGLDRRIHPHDTCSARTPQLTSNAVIHTTSSHL
ncbi:hypothetical protein B0H17DRAFT_1214422 [Mycena rosella]|uniref:Uncharacterized protein n=1 Tax=Mycena rosella TaxID=1033263 RepID=A0AAD7CN56_MYCRO|nr:hypothetical protein B0H17DRAFT_1214422 [Mycena rosella]